MSAAISFAVSLQYASMKSALCSSSAALAVVTVSAIKAPQIIAFIEPLVGCKATHRAVRA